MRKHKETIVTCVITLAATLLAEVLDQYSGLCNYGNWRRSFEPDSAENIALKLNNDFMIFYQKLHMNFP